MNVWECDICTFCQIIKLLSVPCKSIWALAPQSPLFTMNQLKHPSRLDKEHVSVRPPEDPKSHRTEAFCPQRCNDCWSALSTQSSWWWMSSSVGAPPLEIRHCSPSTRGDESSQTSEIYEHSHCLVSLKVLHLYWFIRCTWKTSALGLFFHWLAWSQVGLAWFQP